MPDISIVIPAHNRADLLTQAILSIGEAAPGLDIQVIVIDDASTQDIRGALAGSDVLLQRLEKNSGSSVARNIGLGLVAGRFVKFLDSDDVLVPGALCAEFELAVATRADIVVAGWLETAMAEDQEESEIARHAPPVFGSIIDDLLAGRAVPTSSALYESTLAKSVAWDAGLAKLNDWDYFIGAALRARKIESLPTPAYRWRQHAGARITSSTSFSGNAREFYLILGKLEAALKAAGAYTQPRRLRMAQYLYKELRGMYRFEKDEGRKILKWIEALDPQFVPRDEEHSDLLRLLYRFFPHEWVLSAYGFLRRWRSV
ncbi:MAG: glycosyltransferase family 2 protein [Pseudomonadota bacterium]